MPTQLKISTSDQEGVLGVSKSRKIPILISQKEMEDMISVLGNFLIFDVSRPLTLENSEIPKEEFLRAYGDYVSGVESGELLEEASFRPYFSSIWTLSSDGVYAQRVAGGKFLIKPKVPAIQLQRHHFVFSEGFHSGIMGAESITWGIQFSYPHLFMDPKTKAIGKVENQPEFPNTELFKLLAKWVRSNTRPTPFVVNGQKTNQPIRIGKECFSWINHHPQLKKKGLHVHSSENS